MIREVQRYIYSIFHKSQEKNITKYKKMIIDDLFAGGKQLQRPLCGSVLQR